MDSYNIKNKLNTFLLQEERTRTQSRSYHIKLRINSLKSLVLAVGDLPSSGLQKVRGSSTILTLPSIAHTSLNQLLSRALVLFGVQPIEWSLHSAEVSTASSGLPFSLLGYCSPDTQFHASLVFHYPFVSSKPVSPG